MIHRALVHEPLQRALRLGLLLVLPSSLWAQELTNYLCDDGSRVEVIELPRETVVLFYEDEPAVALTALPSAGQGRLFAADAWGWRMFEDGVAELERSPAPAERWLRTVCSVRG